MSGVSVKPGVLVLRILLELWKAGYDPTINARECLAALVPISRNTDWPLALQELQAVRQHSLLRPDTRRLRHVQEWFRFLGLADIFTRSGSRIGLTDFALESSAYLEWLCAYHEDAATFWMPTSTNPSQLGWSWFNHYGNPDILSQWVLSEPLSDADYLEANYPRGLEQIEEWTEQERLREWSMEINLQSFLPSTPPEMQERPRQLTLDSIARMARGQQRTQRASRLHEELVALVAQKLQHYGYDVAEDRQSVDLLASQAEREAIVEVKTVTRRSLNNRMRLGVGQLSEHRYRRQAQTGSRPSGILVLSSMYRFPDWLTEYFQNDICLGLVTRTTSDQFVAHTTGAFEEVIAS
jgi:hypothetical protein